MATSIEGVRFSDELGALLAHAHAHGFRIEADTRGKRAAGVILYAPDKTIPPITVTERGAKLNRAHYENIRRDIYRAGCPPLPTDTKTEPTTEETPMPPRAKKSVINLPETVHVHNETDLVRALADPETRADVVATMTGNLFAKDPNLQPFSSLAASVVYAVSLFASDEDNDFASAARAALQTEIDDALKMAAEAEAKAARLQTQLDRLEKSEAKARQDCADALRRAEAAEAEAGELSRALAPLRALLGKS